MKNFKAFTYIELMVVVGMVFIVLSISVLSMRQSTRRTEVTLSAQQLASDLRMMESFAASSKENKTKAQNIWGIYVDVSNAINGKYFMYATADTSGVWQNTDDNFNIGYLPKEVKVEEIGCMDTSGAKSPIIAGRPAITFLPPDPKPIFLGCTIADPSGMYITLIDTVSKITKDVTVNNFGLIDVAR